MIFLLAIMRLSCKDQQESLLRLKFICVELNPISYRYRINAKINQLWKQRNTSPALGCYFE